MTRLRAGLPTEPTRRSHRLLPSLQICYVENHVNSAQINDGTTQKIVVFEVIDDVVRSLRHNQIGQQTVPLLIIIARLVL